jgi:hypothetical protein
MRKSILESRVRNEIYWDDHLGCDLHGRPDDHLCRHHHMVRYFDWTAQFLQRDVIDIKRLRPQVPEGVERPKSIAP